MLMSQSHGDTTPVDPSNDREVDPVRRRPRWGTARVAGDSMRPTLHPGDLLLIRYGAEPRVGRCAIVRLPGRGLAVKRVTGREAGGWWVERDNPAAGVDSWLVGAIPAADVVAVVVRRLWPPRRPVFRR
jgi:phage repressor protein C with HTH and peptisase S24 domain